MGFKQVWGARAWRSVAVTLALSVSVAACGVFDDEERLEGERIKIRTAPVERTGSAQTGAPLPAPTALADWTQTNGNSAHNAGHLAGPVSLSLAWSRDIGAGSSDDGQITSSPIVLGGAVYALDAESQVTALDASGGTERWTADLTPEGEKADEGFGGGLAGQGGRIYATTGFGEVLALEASSGEIVWRRRLGAPVRAAPAVNGTLVVAVTRDNRAFGLEAETGEIRWRLPGVAGDAGLLGGASPAIVGRIALLPFASGELVAVETTSGRQIWNAVLTGGRRGLARAAISDVTGDPVAVGPFVIAANQAGRMVAINARDGQRAWTRSIGSAVPLWPVADTVFVMADDASVMRVSARDGATLWRTQLAQFDDPEDREDPIAYSGPVVVSGKVLIASSEGELITLSATTGAEESRVGLSSGALTGPVVAGNTVYLMNDNGVLQAFR